MFLGEFTRLSWVRALATAGVCHRCMGGASGPRLPPWGFWCYSRRCVLLRDPSETWPPQNFTILLVDRAWPFRSNSAISIEDGALLLPGLLDVCSVRCPVSVFTNLAHGVGFDAPGSAYMFTLRHATSMTRRDPEHLQRALQLHTSF